MQQIKQNKKKVQEQKQTDIQSVEVIYKILTFVMHQDNNDNNESFI